MNREEWLKALMVELQPEFATRGHTFPAGLKIVSAIKRNRRSNSANFGLAGCYTHNANEITMTPDNREAVDIAGTLAHELCHATLPREIDHGAPFQKLAGSLGLLPPWRSTKPGPQFTAMVEPMLTRIGPMPPAITLPIAPENPQTLADLALAIRASLAGEDPIEVEAESASQAIWSTYNSTPEAITLEAAQAAFDAAWTAKRDASYAVAPVREKADAEAAKAGENKRRRLDEIRIVTGRWLLQARPMVDQARLGWREWCEANVRRPDGSVPSRTDVDRMMKIAGAADPTAELDRQRAKAKGGMQATRSGDVPNTDDVRDNPITYVPGRSTKATPPVDPEVAAAIEAVSKVTTAKGRAAVAKWFLFNGRHRTKRIDDLVHVSHTESHAVAVQKRLHAEMPEFAALCVAGDPGAGDLIWAAAELWEAANRGGVEP